MSLGMQTRRNLTKAVVVLTLAAALGNGEAAWSQYHAKKPFLQFVGTETYETNGRIWVRYKLSVCNWYVFPDQMFQHVGNGVNPSRTYVTIRDERGKRVYEFTALDRAVDLTGLWFAAKVGDLPPRAVYIELFDRVQKVKFTSNPIQLR